MIGNLWRGVKLLPLVAGLALVAAPAQAQVSCPAMGIIHLAVGQTVQITVHQPPQPVVPPQPCVADIGFTDAAGIFLVNEAGVEFRLGISLMPGQADMVEVPANFGLSRGQRLGIVPVIVPALGTENLPDSCAGLVPSVELYDNKSGQTMAFSQPPEPCRVDIAP